MANDYCTRAQVKALLPGESWGTSYDDILDEIISQASRVIDTHTRVDPGAWAVSSEETRYINGSGKAELFIPPMCALPTSISMAETGEVDGAGGTGGTYTALDNNDYWVEPQNWDKQRAPIRKLVINQSIGDKTVFYPYRRGIKIVGKFGMTTTANTPPEITRATAIQSMKWFNRGKQGFQDVGAIEELAQLRYVRAIDPEVEAILMRLSEKRI